MEIVEPKYSSCDDVVRVSIPAGHAADEPVEIGAANVLVEIGEGARVRLFRRTVCGEGRCRIDVGDNASVVFEQLVTSEGVQTCDMAIASSSRVKVVTCCVADGKSEMNFNIDLAGGGSEVEVWGLYVAGGDDRVDMNVNLRHLVSDCKSSEMVKGLAAGSAAGRFHGRIYVAKDAQRTDAVQQSRNLLLSAKARVFTEPQLEIYADDVKCGHGATVGQLDGEAVYYMRQRGIDEKDARLLQMNGFVDDIIRRFDDAELHDEIREMVEKKTDRF